MQKKIVSYYKIFICKILFFIELSKKFWDCISLSKTKLNMNIVKIGQTCFIL